MGTRGKSDDDKVQLQRFITLEFVAALGYTASDPDWGDSPDAVLTLRKGQIERRVAIEHTGYFNDREAGVEGQGAPLAPVSIFWECVLASLGPLINEKKHLGGIHGSIDLFPGPFARKLDRRALEELAAKFSQELVAFLECHPITGCTRFPGHTRPSPGTAFDGFPTLRSLVSSMDLTPCPTDYFSPHNWPCWNIRCGFADLNLGYIKSTIKKHNEQATKYNWRSAGEKWLLIAATDAGDASTHAGAPDEQKFDDQQLRDLCRESPFDKVYFWARAWPWYKSLKPNEGIVCPVQTPNS